MGISGAGLSGLVQGIGQGIDLYNKVDSAKRLKGFYEEMSALMKERRAIRGDKGGSQFGPQLTDDTSQAVGVAPADAAGLGQPTMQTVAQPATAPIPAVAAPIGYGPGAQPAGLANAVTPMVTRPATGNVPSPYAPDPLLMKRPGLGG